MYTRRYFIAALILPLLVILMFVIYAWTVLAVSFHHLGAMLVPYACFVLFLSVWASRHSPQMIREFAYRTPIVFLLFQIAYLVLEYNSGVSLATDIGGLTGILIFVSTYVMIFGYVYLLLMEQGYIAYLHRKRFHGTIRHGIADS